MNVPEERPTPYEVPWREVEHQEAGDRWDIEGRDFIGGVGSLREREWWGGKKENDAETAEIRRKEKARKKLGGFGFR